MPGTITLEKMYEVFATKDELRALGTSVGVAAEDLKKVVPREEHELHWRMDDLFRADMKEAVNKLDTRVEEIAERMPPRWLLPLLGISSPIVAVLVAHFWR